MPSTATDRLFGLSTSVAVKAPCKAVATSNITLSGLQTINGVAVVEDDRVLVTAQSSGVNNGIYLASTGTWQRAADFDGARDVVQGTQIPIARNGAQTALYEVATANPIYPGTTAITFTLRYSANLQYDITAAEIAAGVTPVNYAYLVSPSIDPRRYGFSTAASAATNAAALQDALDVANSGGGEVVIPEGTFNYDTSLLIYKKTTLRGMGRQKSILVYTGTSDGIQSTWPIDSSTGVWITVCDLSIICNNASSAGAAFADVGGTFVHIQNIYSSGFKFGVIFDQTEISHIKDSEFLIPAISGSAGVWLVNGADHTVGADTFYTNRIVIDGNAFNTGYTSAYGIVDDGGIAHTITNNNFNAGAFALRAAGVFGLVFTGNYSEVMSGGDLQLTNTTLATANVEPCSGLDISGNTLLSSSVARNIDLVDAAGGAITKNIMGNATTCIALGTKASGVLIEHNSKIITGSSPVASTFVDGTAASFRANIVRQTAQTFVTTALGATGSQTVTPATMEFIDIGTRLSCRNQDNSNHEIVIVTAKTSTTFTAVFASTKTARWSIHGLTPANDSESTWTPVVIGTGTAGTHTYSVQVGTYVRRGNFVHAKAHIEVSTTSGTWTGNIRITGLPFTAENVTNSDASVHVSNYSGFTFAAGGVSMGGFVAPNTNYIDLRKMASGVAIAAIPVTDVAGATFVLYLDVSYYTSSN